MSPCLNHESMSVPSVRPLLFQMVIGPLYHATIPDFGVKHGRDQDGQGGGPLQPEAGDDLGGEEGRERHRRFPRAHSRNDE
jgi:hypothetical protein